MSTVSLRKDHDLIEKVIKSMEVTLQLLKNGKTIPESILLPVIDFSKNFTNVCHHGKEEESLFPALEKTGMPRNMGPIAVMLMEHQMTKQIADRMEESKKKNISRQAPLPISHRTLENTLSTYLHISGKKIIDYSLWPK